MSGYTRISRWGWAIACLAGVACAVVGWQSHALEVDPSNRAFFVRAGEAYDAYQTFLERFGSDETIVVGVRMAGGLTPALAGWVQEVTQALRALPYVEGIRSLATVTRLQRTTLGRLIEYPRLTANAGRALPPDPTPEEPLLLSRDGRTAAIILHVARELPDLNAQHTLISDVRRVLAAHRRPDVAYLVTGTVVEQATLLTRMRKDRDHFIPLTVVIVTVLLLLLHAEWRSVFYALAVMGGSLAATEGVMAWRHVSLNVVTGLLAPIILIVAVSLTVQISASFLHLPRGASPSTRLATVYRAMGMPCLLASLTTLIGFLTLLVSPVPAVRQFGAFGALGTMIAWALAMAWIPVCLSLAGERSSRVSPAFQAVGRALGGWTVRHRWAVVAVAAALMMTWAVWGRSVRASTNLLEIFRADDPFRRETETLQRELEIIYPLELELDLPAATPLTSPKTWRTMERFQAVAGRLPLVARTISLTDVLRYIEQVAGMPSSERLLTQILNQLPQRLGPSFHQLTSPDYRHLRMILYLQRWETADVMTAAGQLRTIASTLLPPGWRLHPTGHIVLLSQMSQRLVDDEVASVALAFGVILGLMWLAMRSLTYALISLAPNLLPIVGLFGFMGKGRIPLNIATAMSASVAIGLIFNNTIQVLYRYRDARRAGASAQDAVNTALMRCAQPMVASSLVVAGGFAVTLRGQMVTTVQFGVLTCTIIGLAMLGDLVVLPALLAIGKPR